MEQSWEKWTLDMEMDEYDEDLLELEQWQNEEDEEFLRGILRLQEPEPSDEAQYIVHNDCTAGSGSGSGSGSDNGKRPRTYILAFDKSAIIPATPDPAGPPPPSSTPNSSKKRNPNQRPPQPQPKKFRTDSQILDHIMAERKRRQELTERFIALSATIPGLKKTDKATILGEAISYVKQLQERVTELEKLGGTKSMIFVKKGDVGGNEDSSCGSSRTSPEDCSAPRPRPRPRPSESLPDVQARVLGKEILIEIHCEKENGIERQILDRLENLNLCVTASSVLPFGNSTLGITIIAKMGEDHIMTVNDLVNKLRQVLLNHTACNSDPY